MTTSTHDWPEGLTYSRLVRYVACQPCTEAKRWDEAWSALASCPDTGPDYQVAHSDLVEKQGQCGCTPCTARRVVWAKEPS